MLPNFAKSLAAKAALKEIARNNDTKTTVLGLVSGAILTSQVDFGKLFQGDPNEVGKLVGAVVAIAWGYYTNKPHKATPAEPQAAPEEK